MDKIIVFSNKTEGRDKFCKVLQYGSRMLKAVLASEDTKTRLQGLFTASRDARKMFRLWKSMHEYDAILKLLHNKSMHPFEKFIQLASKTAMFFYWIFDNLGILTSVKFLKMNSGKLGKSAMTAWFVGIVFSLIYFLRKLYLNLNSENRIKKSESNPQLAIESKIQIKKERQAIVLGIIKNLGDLVPASNGANVPQLLFKKSFTDKWIGLGGLISALISCYQAWP